MPYDPTIYLGSAAHYRVRPPGVLAGLEGLLTREVGLDGSGRLLDGGCGPGVLTVRLAHLFAKPVGLDPDADMLAEGARAAGGARDQRTSGGSGAWPRTCPPPRPGRTGW